MQEEKRELSEIKIVNLGFNDVNPEFFGKEKCLENHTWGPGIRNAYHLHFVIEGEGEFKNSHNKFHVHKGQGFLFVPGECVYYKADAKNPWCYIWLGFTGEKANELLGQCNINPGSPIFDFNDSFDISTYYEKAGEMKNGTNCYVLSILYRFFAMQNKCFDRTEKSKTDLAIEYIIKNYSQKMSVNSIAQYLNIDRRYFCKLFKKNTGMSPQQYIIQIRMVYALELLKNHKGLSVNEVANSVGYSDPLAFSKMFKKVYNLTPTDILNGVYPTEDGKNQGMIRKNNTFPDAFDNIGKYKTE